MPEEKNDVEQTTNPEAGVDETKPIESELDGDKSKNVEEVEKELELLREQVKKAEHTIVKLKGQNKEIKEDKSIDVEAIRKGILEEVESKISPKLEELSELEEIKKKNRELTEALAAKNSQSGLGDAPSVKKAKDNTPKPTEKDVRIAQNFGMSIEDYMKYKRKKEF
jgi:hypothetical protein